MSSRPAMFCGHLPRGRWAVVVVLCSLSMIAAAQDQPAPKWELYGGYSFFYPGTDVHGLLPGGLLPVSSRLESNPRGLGASVTYDFNRWIGLTGDVSGQKASDESGVAMRVDDASFFNGSLGPKLTFRTRHFSPFIEVLGGWHRLTSDLFQRDDEFGFMAGGGLDVNLNRHFALRLIRGDYVFSNHQFGPSSIVPATDVRGARLQSGLVFMWRNKMAVPPPPTAQCSVQPAQAFAGEPLTATAVGSGFNLQRDLQYNWTGSGVKTGETGSSTQLDTAALPTGHYQVTASLSDGSHGGHASCTAGFIVQAAHPPLISCAADPSSVTVGGTSTINSNARSPDGRNLTYNYSASAGSITGSASTATLDTTGTQPGTVTVTCNVSDDRNPSLSSSSLTTVTVQAAPPPPPDVSEIKRRLALHSVYFATARPRLENPDAGLLASQEKTLTALARDFITYLQSKGDALLTLEGHADPRGSAEYNQALSQRRVERVKRFLVEQGVPAANIQTQALGEQENLTDQQVKAAVERNPELSPEDRQRVLSNMRTIILASNRRVDITLSGAGEVSQESIREYPFNAADSLTLLEEQATGKATTPARRKVKKNAQ